MRTKVRTNMADVKKPVDWAGIEKDFVNGDWSIRKIAEWYQISEAAIRKRAKAKGWVRRVEAKKVCEPVPGVDAPVVTVDVDATKPENIVTRGQNLVFRLLSELEAASSSASVLEELIEMHEEDPRRKAAMLAAVSLKGRSDVVKALATAFKTWSESQPGAQDGKKAQRQASAEARVASGGRFSPGAPPKLAVDNTK